jgi:hypothetical protein
MDGFPPETMQVYDPPLEPNGLLLHRFRLDEVGGWAWVVGPWLFCSARG